MDHEPTMPGEPASVNDFVASATIAVELLFGAWDRWSRLGQGERGVESADAEAENSRRGGTR